MAVLDKIQVTVQVDGKNSQEYDDPDADSDLVNKSTISKYIEAISKAKFDVLITVPDSYKFVSEALIFWVALDGKKVQGAIFRKGRDRLTRRLAGVSRLGDKGGQLRPFMFAEVNFSEEPSAPARDQSKCERFANLGHICVTVHKVKIIGNDEPRGWDKEELLPSLQIAEKDIKGRNLTHASQLGDIESTAAANILDIQYLDGIDHPSGTFVFKYCSKRALQSLALIPRSPTPVPLEERPFESLTRDEMHELVRRQQARYQAERATSTKREAQIKREGEHGRGFKRERDEEIDELLATSSARKVRTRSFTPGEIVELD